MAEHLEAAVKGRIISISLVICLPNADVEGLLSEIRFCGAVFAGKGNLPRVSGSERPF